MSRGARRLLALYPRAWRDRYGDEFLALLGDEPLRVNQIVNIISGAIDARLSPGARVSMDEQQGALAPQGGSAVTSLRHLCALDRKSPYTLRDAWTGAGITVVTATVLAFGGAYLRRRGLEGTGEFMSAVAFPASVIWSSHFTFLKGQPFRVRWVITGGTLAIVSALTVLAAFI